LAAIIPQTYNIGMDARTWEYCQLSLTGMERDEGGGWRYFCTLQYLTTEGSRPIDLADGKSVLPENPFRLAMARLGAAGWELVALESDYTAAGNPTARMSGAVRGNLRGFEARDVGADMHLELSLRHDWTRRFAFFKRPIVEGRPIDEPPVSL
jgi:hypothetical protein